MTLVLSWKSTRIRRLIGDLRDEWQGLNERIAAFDAEFVSRARTDEAARRLTSIREVGSINATALMAAVGNGRAFARGRDMAAWLGLVPRQRTTGGKPRLLGISKRGNRYLNLIHGTCSAAVSSSARHAARPLGSRAIGASPQEYRGSGARQQTGAYRLGSVGSRWPIRCRARRQRMRGVLAFCSGNYR